MLLLKNVIGGLLALLFVGCSSQTYTMNIASATKDINKCTYFCKFDRYSLRSIVYDFETEQAKQCQCIFVDPKTKKEIIKPIIYR